MLKHVGMIVIEDGEPPKSAHFLAPSDLAGVARCLSRVLSAHDGNTEAATRMLTDVSPRIWTELGVEALPFPGDPPADLDHTFVVPKNWERVTHASTAASVTISRPDATSVAPTPGCYQTQNTLELAGLSRSAQEALAHAIDDLYHVCIQERPGETKGNSWSLGLDHTPLLLRRNLHGRSYTMHRDVLVSKLGVPFLHSEFGARRQPILHDRLHWRRLGLAADDQKLQQILISAKAAMDEILVDWFHVNVLESAYDRQGRLKFVVGGALAGLGPTWTPIGAATTALHNWWMLQEPRS